LTADSILKRIKAFEDNKIDDVLTYLTEKLGLSHLVKDDYERGLQLAASWSLIDKNQNHADFFFC